MYVILKILKYCTGSSARSYQCKYAVNDAFHNKDIKSLEEVGAAIKEVIQYNTIRGKFSSISIHPDLAAEGITRVEVGEEGLHFIRETGTGRGVPGQGVPLSRRQPPTLGLQSAAGS